MEFLARPLGAALDLIVELPAIAAVGMLIGPRLRNQPLGLGDIVATGILGACLFVLLRRAFGGEREVVIRRGAPVRVDVPAVSFLHFVLDALWIYGGVGLLKPPRNDVDVTMGLACVLVPGLLIVARLVSVVRDYRRG